MGRRYFSRVSSKGQITLPADVRSKLDIKPRDRVEIHLDDDVVTISRGGGLKEIWSRVPSRGMVSGLDWKDIEDIAHDDHAQRAAREGLE